MKETEVKEEKKAPAKNEAKEDINKLKDENEKKDIENDLKIFILNSLASTVYNTEISERTFDFLLKNFRQRFFLMPMKTPIL